MDSDQPGFLQGWQAPVCRFAVDAKRSITAVVSSTSFDRRRPA
jgi:hypothetical protein